MSKLTDLQKECLLEQIRAKTNLITLEGDNKSVIFMLVYNVSESIYIALRAPSSVVRLCEDNRYPVTIGYADSRKQFAEVIFDYLYIKED